MSLCPKCGAAHLVQLTAEMSGQIWLECRTCRHSWSEKPQTPALRCSKCQSDNVSVSRSADPPLVFLRCGRCGYSSALAVT